MKNIFKRMGGAMLTLAFLSIMFISCSDNEDNRAYESAKIVGVKIDNELFTPSEAPEGETKIVVPAGRDLSKVKLQILVANGDVIDFTNNSEYDCRKPMSISIQGNNGTKVDTKLRIQSAPKLVSFIIKGMTIPNTDIYESNNSLIVQVPKDTNLTGLEVTMEFSNGILVDFENGKPLDYTDPRTFKLKGVDDETIYPYNLIITTETVGPAVINSIVVNGIETDSIVVKDNKLIPYVPSMMTYTSVDIELSVGFGNKIDPSFSGKGLNLMTGNNKVKVTGTNGIETEFTIGVPQWSFKPLFAKKYTTLKNELGYKDNDLCAVGFSGNSLLAGSYTVTRAPIYFDFSGQKQGSLNETGVDPTGYGFRKFATDDKGAVLVLSLGMSDKEQWVYKYDNINDQGKEYLSFSKASLGVSYSPRSAGISIMGSLDGDATIVIPMAQQTDIFVWKVTGGVLNSTPQKYSFPYTGTSYYWSIIPMPIGMTGYLGFATTNNSAFSNGIVCLDANMGETQKLTGMVTTDGKVIKYKERVFLAYTAHSNNKGIMRICDITDGQLDSYKNPVFEQVMEETGGNTNATMDADFTIIDGKLYAAFACTNIGLSLYCFDK